MVVPDRVIDRVLAKVVVAPSGCHLSTYSTASHGYAQVGWTGEDGRRIVTLCHRVAWIAEYGPIPPGLVVDHLCHERRCINVEHLRLLTNFENARRTFGRNWPLGQCANGHPNSELEKHRGKWRCSICARHIWKHAKAAA